MELALKSDRIEKTSYQLKGKGDDITRFKQTQFEQAPLEIIEANQFKRKIDPTLPPKLSSFQDKSLNFSQNQEKIERINEVNTQ